MDLVERGKSLKRRLLNLPVSLAVTFCLGTWYPIYSPGLRALAGEEGGATSLSPCCLRDGHQSAHPLHPARSMEAGSSVLMAALISTLTGKPGAALLHSCLPG